MYSDIEKLMKEDKEFCEKKLREINESPEENDLWEYASETPQYWQGRIAEIEIVLNFINF